MDTISDHLYGFVAFLTTREQTISVGRHKVVYDVMECLQEYLKANNLGDPSAEYPDTFTMPS